MSFPEIDARQSFVVINGNDYFLLKLVEYGRSCRFEHLDEHSSPKAEVVGRYLSENHTFRRFPLRLNQSDKNFLRRNFPEIYEATEELHVECFLSKNDQVIFKPDGIMLGGEYKRRNRRLRASIFIKEVAHSKGWKVQQQVKVSSNATKSQPLINTVKPSGIDLSKLEDVDTLVARIEGTYIKPSDPKKAAKKARQKERKEMEMMRQLIEEEKIVDETLKMKQEELEVEDFIQEKWRLEDEERKQQDDLVRKQEEADVMQKVEQPLKLEEIEWRKTEKKKLKKQRRDQRKKELEGGEDYEEEKETKNAQDRQELIAMAEPKRESEDKKAAKETAEIDSEKNFGRIKYEKEQRKREEEEARRLKQLQAHARAKANKKNKKKKKQKNISESSIQSASDGSDQGSQNDSSESKSVPAGAFLLNLLKAGSSRLQGKDDERNNLVTIKKPMDHSEKISKEGEKDLIYTPMNGQVHPTNNDGRIRSEDAFPPQQTAFVKPETIRPNHIRTPSDNGGYQYATPAKAMGYAVYPTNNDAHTRSEDILPVQQTAFFKSETVWANHIISNSEGYVYGTPVKAMGYPGHSQSHGGGTYPSPVMSDTSASGEIGLSQRKLPPGFNITNAPQHLTDGHGDDYVNGMQHPDFKPKQVQSSMNDYAHISSMSGIDTGYNPNVVVGNRGCSTLESPAIGIQPSDVMYGAYGTKPSSEAPVGYDRPNSWMDSVMNDVRGDDDVYGMQHPDFKPKQVQSSMTEYACSSSMSGIDTGYNSNVVVGNSRCSSLESPVIGIRPSNVMYGAYGTRPSSEAPVGYDRPNSGMDSVCHNDMSPHAPRPAFYSNEMLHARGPTFPSSPFESSSSGLERDYNSSINGMPGMIPSTSVARPNGQGLWSSTPASPLANNGAEILRAQGQRLKFRNVGFGVMGEGSSSSGFTSEIGMTHQKTVQFNQSSSMPANPRSYAVDSTTHNGSYASRVQPGSPGTREVTLPSHSRTYDLWSSPLGSPSSTCQSSPLMMPPQHDKETGNLTMNPYGPIGSLISRKSSSDSMV